MNWFVKWGIKKYALSALNTVLDGSKNGMQKALAVCDKYIAKAEAVLAFLKSLRAKLADNKIDADETDAILLEGEALVKEVLK